MRQKFYPLPTPSTSALRGLWIALTVVAMQLASLTGSAQNCPTSGTHTQSGNENTFYSGLDASLPAGSTSITLGAVPSSSYGTAGIVAGDFVLIIQMQGATFNIPASTTSTLYGGNSSGVASGFLAAGLQAGNMEYAIATNTVPTSGGTLTISAGLTNSYSNTPYGTWGKYTYQVIRVPAYYNLTLSGTINTPQWNGSVGGVTVMNAVNDLNFGSATINALGMGFRGGGGRGLSGASGQNKNDYYVLSTVTADASKGEGIAGTPRYIIFNNTLVTGPDEGYPSGSYGRGGVGNAGGGANDSNPISNDQNAGGGGGGNGGAGGTGGNGWYSFGATGGKGGTAFQTYGPTTIRYNASHLVLGGGGGAGSTNNNSGTYGALTSSGAPGGGIVIVNALTVTGSGTINASGAAGNSTVTVDGSGGGGAGGSILIYATSGLGNITAIANGGQGADNHPAGSSATQHGPGGGGGGGVILSPSALSSSSTVTNGIAGISYGSNATDNYGALSGNVGSINSSVTSSQLPPNMIKCQSTVLPVTLLSFTATHASSGAVNINWATTNEVNFSRFIVERSVNGVDFGAIDQVAASGSYEAEHQYSTIDPLTGVTSSIVYYRLRLVDQDGKFAYSKTIPVKLDQQEANLMLYPNPAITRTVLSIHADRSGNGTIRLVDNSGRTVKMMGFTAYTGTNSVPIEDLGALPRGVYIVQVMLNNTLYNQKLVKQ